ncbi:FadR/GntR family transcriptional regulator [Bacillus xiapuensis]|uniref:FadR/GntR family transcriptional regulator n=1 Tax=Bacillus xiapuensis TaxID=2014075 RepID=UPI000C236366|nr:GntR family transcriptional regulator [Bacillus xiapuensis]
MNRSRSKFEEVVGRIRQIIVSDGLLPGDKLPSERELSERLSVARSSVREALRALELLGLIETRRGEGTFLRDFHDHQLVQLLSTFILQNEQKKQDVRRTQQILELGCLSSAIQQPDFDSSWAKVAKSMKSASFSERDFFTSMMDASRNQLLKTIWLIVSDYAASFHQGDRLTANRQAFLQLMEKLKTKNIQEIFEAYKQLG